MDKNKIYLGLKKFCLGEGVDLFGVAELGSAREDFNLPKELLAKFDKGVSLGMRLSESVLSEITQAPTKLYFHHYRTVNNLLDQIALKVNNHIQKKGFRSLPVPASQVLDWNQQNAHLSHKKIGLLAGLGWIGRNNLLVNSRLGAHFRLVTILTDMPLKTDKPIKRDCESCGVCVKICPAAAIKESPLDFDHIRCFQKLKEFHKLRLAEQYICGVCVNVCRGEYSKRGRAG